MKRLILVQAHARQWLLRQNAATFYVAIMKEEDLAKSAYTDVCTPGNPRDVSEAEILELHKSIH